MIDEKITEGMLNIIKTFKNPTTEMSFNTIETEITKFKNKEYLEVVECYHVEIVTWLGEVDKYIANKFSTHTSYIHSCGYRCKESYNNIVIVDNAVENIKNHILDIFNHNLNECVSENRNVLAYKGSKFVFDIIPNSVVVRKHKYIKINNVSHELSSTTYSRKNSYQYIKVDSLFEYNETGGKFECVKIASDILNYYESLRESAKKVNVKQITKLINKCDADRKNKELEEKVRLFNELKEELGK